MTGMVELVHALVQELCLIRVGPRGCSFGQSLVGALYLESMPTHVWLVIVYSQSGKSRPGSI